MLSGKSDVSGRTDVAVSVTIDHQVRKLDEAVLRWGREKVVSIKTERVGVATQKFVIDVLKGQP